METKLAEWLLRNTWTSASWTAAHLAESLQAAGESVAVILPALNEAATVGTIVGSIHRNLVEAVPLVSELVVVDSGSTDETAEIAAAAGARVVQRTDVLPDIEVIKGKGEAMWRGLAATTSDLVVFVDADLQSFTPDYVVGLLGPLVANPHIQLVKAIYERPLVAGEKVIPAGGGRVTELMARPLLNQFWPELAGVVQPLAGEYAARRGLLESTRFPCGYGVEIALLIDTYNRHGLAAIGQVDLGVRVHRHHDDSGLGIMAAEILATVTRRLPVAEPTGPGELIQFDRTPRGYRPKTRTVSQIERPPLASVRGSNS